MGSWKFYPLSPSLPLSLQMSCNQTGCPGITSDALVLTENETERDRWLATLEELQKAAKQSTQHGVSNTENETIFYFDN